jgi:predicted dehydrogenase
MVGHRSRESREQREPRYYVIGIFGDVFLTRKAEFLLFNQIKEKLRFSGGFDIHEPKQVLFEDGLRGLLDTRKKNHLKGKLSEDVEEELVRGMLKGDYQYGFVGATYPRLPASFLVSLTPKDIVDISTPGMHHVNYLIQLIRDSRASILVEKPVVASRGEIAAVECALRDAQRDGNLEGRVFIDAEHYSHYGVINNLYLLFEKNMVNHGEGYNLGKVKGIKFNIKETEGFDSQRNRDVIDITKSGGGIWRDLGPHVVGPLSRMGVFPDYSTLQTKKEKVDDPRIADSKYGETAMHITFRPNPMEFLTPDCWVKIDVGKAMDEKDKSISLFYEHGKVILNIAERTMTAQRNGQVIYRLSPTEDPFEHVLNDSVDSVIHSRKPLTTLEEGLRNIEKVIEMDDRKYQTL